jgi:hypothetical protein
VNKPSNYCRGLLDFRVKIIEPYRYEAEFDLHSLNLDQDDIRSFYDHLGKVVRWMDWKDRQEPVLLPRMRQRLLDIAEASKDLYEASRAVLNARITGIKDRRKWNALERALDDHLDTFYAYEELQEKTG